MGSNMPSNPPFQFSVSGILAPKLPKRLALGRVRR